MRFESSITFTDPLIARAAWLSAVLAVDPFDDHGGDAPLWANVLAEAWRRRWPSEENNTPKTFDDALYAAYTVSLAVGAPTDRLYVFIHEYTTCTGTVVYLNSDLKLSIGGLKADSVARRYAAASKVAETEPAPTPDPEPEPEVIDRHYPLGEDQDELPHDFEGLALDGDPDMCGTPENPDPVGLLALSAIVTRVVPL